MIPDLTTRAQCKDLIQTEGTCVQMEGRNSYSAGMKSSQHVAPPEDDP